MSSFKYKCLYVLTIIALILYGCGGPRIPDFNGKDYKEKGIRLIALMPVDNKTKDAHAAQVLRRELLETLYFKGYPKIPLDIIDEKAAKIYNDIPGPQRGKIPPRVLGELLGVDAVMYCSLENWDTSYFFISAKTVISVTFELRSAKTGETLWRAADNIVERHFDFTKKRLEIKSSQAYEPILQEIIKKAMSTLPDGPDSIEKLPSKKSWWRFW
jgi:hypothetical protein